MPTTQRVKGPGTRRAFTLLELLIVVSIIAFLAAVLVVGGGRFIASAKVKRSEALLSNLTQALTDYHSEFGAFPPTTISGKANTNEWWRYLTCAGDFARPQRADGTVRDKPFIEEKDLNLGPPSVSPRLPRDGWKNPILYVYPVDNEIANLSPPTSDRGDPASVRQLTVADTYYHCMVISRGKTGEWPDGFSVSAGRDRNDSSEPSPSYMKKVVSGQ